MHKYGFVGKLAGRYTATAASVNIKYATITFAGTNIWNPFTLLCVRPVVTSINMNIMMLSFT